MSQVQGKGPTWAVLVISKVGLRGDRRSDGDEVLDPLRQALDSSMQSHNLYQHQQRPAFHVSAPVASTVQQVAVYLDLCLIFLLLRFSLRIRFFLHLALMAQGFPKKK
uniref:Uncharacterized protein n=1 Tax=Callithrix jacchus TaxID=9483 RepID=A0A8I4A1F3_CALJA